MFALRKFRIAGAIAAVCVATLAGCATEPTASSGKPDISIGRISEDRLANALVEVQRKQSKGQRVWCVPFARDLSGIDIRGNAKTWWEQAKGRYGRSQEPAIGSVMTFKATRKNPNGHVAVVSQMLSERQVRLDHTNWERNRVSRDMLAVDVSQKNDWSVVRLESAPGQLGAQYPVQGFILPN
ncbi:CHAP domain-containing protein [Paracoccus laeviglucosivorans]|uniref:CHAP domain-containing protein n=1 Tax=Paracoccus laeviglucosivorans TaxID=1197861 RepID=A0A521FPL0_9RHOB|nr:CHAP domain-containing protein [Paracoccus laeviglucosivorans]SMO98112.1 CHAP domain-containing protein [Paracoccus laeviglucosivorans]